MDLSQSFSFDSIESLEAQECQSLLATPSKPFHPDFFLSVIREEDAADESSWSTKPKCC
jgi:hypothetical protein